MLHLLLVIVWSSALPLALFKLDIWWFSVQYITAQSLKENVQ